jgi:hypothetical protein
MKTTFGSILAFWTGAVALVFTSGSAAARPAPRSFAELANPIASVVASSESSSEVRRSIEREVARMAKTPAALQPQQPPQRNWAGRHPVALSVMMGAAGGTIWAVSECRAACEGGSLTGPMMTLGASVGAGIGAGIGAIISRVRR